MQNKKISQFNEQQSINDSDFIDFVSNGTNYRVSFSNFKLSLGALGQLSQLGSPTGIPVLRVQGVDYQIRNIESGPGITATFSSFNGVKISTNFEQDTQGIGLVDDLTKDKPIFRSLTPGQGINISETNNEIQISAVTATVSSRTVIVSEVGDFPPPVSGVITLADKTDYLLVQDIVTANRFIVGSETSVRASGSQIINFEYTGTETFFSGTNPNFRIDRVTLKCSNASLFNMTSPSGQGIVQIVEANVEDIKDGGTIDGDFITRFSAIGWENIQDNGITFTGTHQNLEIDTSVVFINNGSFLDLGTATFNVVNVTKTVMTALGPSTLLSGATGSANINPGGLGVVSNNRLFGPATGLNGISVEDSRWNFALNDDIADTRPDSLLSTINNVNQTVISATNTPVKVVANFIIESQSQFNSDVTGRAEYLGDKNAKLPITASVSASMVSGGAKTLTFYIAINGVAVASARAVADVSSSTITRITLPWQYEFATNDFVEIWVENNTDTTNVLVVDAILRVN